ncbi:uncharacterized protein LOC143606191 [Bidens hawaiensis]|uniref:uncharacterized protein LOC143606191 n=1 Tax=Bidens hawaiensis TaxID=980011 RepID=UPI004049174A
MTLTGMEYDPIVGDLIALTQVKPKRIDDFSRSSSSFVLAYVTNVINKSPMTVALNRAANMDIIQRTLSSTCSVAKDCDKCCTNVGKGVIDLKLRHAFDSFKLDTSQEAAVLSCLAAKMCTHGNSCTKLIWGPPGTGKTKTIASLLFVLLRTKHRTLTCAPTNVAVVGVAKRLLSLVSDYDLGCDTYGFGDIVLFGNTERMKINNDHEELLDVFLDNRIVVLGSCLSLWKTYTGEMIRLLQNPMKEYQCLKVLKKIKTKTKKKNEQKLVKNQEGNHLTFEEFVMNRFNGLSKKLIACIRNLYTHLPTSLLSLKCATKLNHSVTLIQEVGESVKEIVTRKQG